MSSVSSGGSPRNSRSSSPYPGPKSGLMLIALPAYPALCRRLSPCELSLTSRERAVNVGKRAPVIACRVHARGHLFWHNPSFRLKPQVIICCPVLGAASSRRAPVGVGRHGRREPRSVVATASAGGQQRADAATAADAAPACAASGPACTASGPACTASGRADAAWADAAWADAPSARPRTPGGRETAGARGQAGTLAGPAAPGTRCQRRAAAAATPAAGPASVIAGTGAGCCGRLSRPARDGPARCRSAHTAGPRPA